MNKLDPRVDSTADHRPVVANTNAHHSKIANVLDPRVDSSVANDPNVGIVGGGGVTGGPRHTGIGVGGAGAGAVPPTAGTGYHSSHAGATHTGPTEFQVSPASGPASHTAGPHRSNIMNKLDPAVDSRTGSSHWGIYRDHHGAESHDRPARHSSAGYDKVLRSVSQRMIRERRSRKV